MLPNTTTPVNEHDQFSQCSYIAGGGDDGGANPSDSPTW